MPYFLILPAFVIGEAVLLAGIVAASTVSSLRRFRPHLTQVLLWATLGFLVANAVTIGAMICAFVVADKTTAGEWAIVKVLLAFLMFVAPFVASIGGALAGTLLGLRKASAVTGAAEQ